MVYQTTACIDRPQMVQLHLEYLSSNCVFLYRTAQLWNDFNALRFKKPNRSLMSFDFVGHFERRSRLHLAQNEDVGQRLFKQSPVISRSDGQLPMVSTAHR